jgi:hypothetical protein
MNVKPRGWASISSILCGQIFSHYAFPAAFMPSSSATIVSFPVAFPTLCTTASMAELLVSGLFSIAAVIQNG